MKKVTFENRICELVAETTVNYMLKFEGKVFFARKWDCVC